MKNNKVKKSKFYAVAAMGVAAVALTGVGFSAWIISTQESKVNTGDISVVVDDVKDQTVSLELLGTSGLTTDNAVRFDAAASDSSGPIVWDGTNSEDLTFGITFKIATADATNFKGISVCATEAAAKLSTWVSKDWIIAPFKIDTNTATNYVPLVYSAWTTAGDHYLKYAKDPTAPTVVEQGGAWNAHVKVEAGTNEYTYTVEYKFQWGSAFGEKNPSLMTGSEDNYSTALTALKTFGKAANNCNFKLHLKHDPGNEVKLPETQSK